MTPRDEGPSRSIEPVVIGFLARLALGVAGALAFVAGGVAVFTTHSEAGPVALIAAGSILLMIGLAGALPTRLKLGENEAQWQREVARSVQRIDRASDEVGSVLDRSGVSLDALLSGESATREEELPATTERVESLERDVRFVRLNVGDGAVPPKALLELARWYLAEQDWAEAARYLNSYVGLLEADWETYFSLGVANANLRGGGPTDRAALRAYDQAVARMPDGTASPLVPRLYSYRAAIKKRLGRLVEARADAQVAKQLAESRYDLVDATYNLAGIEAMLGHRDEAIRELKELKQHDGMHLVAPHLNDYFALLADDPEFQGLLAGN